MNRDRPDKDDFAFSKKKIESGRIQDDLHIISSCILTTYLYVKKNSNLSIFTILTLKELLNLNKA